MQKSEEYRKEVGNRLKEALKYAGIKNTELAAELGVANNTISQWVRGLREPRYEILHFLFERYKINPNYIILGVGDPIIRNEALQQTQKIQITQEEEQVLRETYKQIVTVLENHDTPWKVVPQSVIEAWKKECEKKNQGFFRRVWDFVKEATIKTIFTGYAGFELIANRILFFVNAYWEQMMQAIWHCYWAMKQEKVPNPEDIAILGLLYTGKKNFTEAALEIQKILRNNEVVNWNFTEEEIKQSSKEINFKPFQEGEIQPFAYMYLRQAGRQLVDLAILKNLPKLCLIHNKIYWTNECPICIKFSEKQ